MGAGPSFQQPKLRTPSMLQPHRKPALQTREKNDKLLTENEMAKGKLDDICSENSKLVLQLVEYERLLLQKEDCLGQNNLQLEELQTEIEEYKLLLELKTEKNGLQDQFSQNNEDMNINTHLSQNQCPSNQPQQSVCKELQEVLEFDLPDPMCGISEDTSLQTINMIPEDVCTEIELMLDHLKQLAYGLHSNLQDITSFSLSVSQPKEQSSILVESLRCLMQMKCAWETYASKLNGAPQINTQEELSPLERTRLEQSVKTVNMQLVTYQRPNERHHRNSLTEGFLSWLRTEACRLLMWLRIDGGSSLSIPWILLLVFLCSFLLLPTSSREHIWTVLAGLLWPHLRMQYLDIPPF